MSWSSVQSPRTRILTRARSPAQREKTNLKVPPQKAMTALSQVPTAGDEEVHHELDALLPDHHRQDAGDGHPASHDEAQGR